MTIRQIAERVHLSKSAVSLALRDDPSIPEATRNRVKSAAKRLRYFPNAKVATVMSAIAKHTTSRIQAPIAVISMWPKPAIWKESSENLGRFYSGCASRAAELGYRLEEFWVNAPGMTAARMQGIMAARGIEGALVFCYPSAPARLEIDLSPYASVVLGRALASPRVFAVDHDHHQGLLVALDQVAARGYRRPALVISRDSHERTMHCWAAAYQFAMSQRKRTERIPMWILEASDWRGFDRWFRLHRPDLLLVNDNHSLDGLRTRKADVIGDVGLASLFLHKFDGKIAGIDTLDEVQGSRAIDILVGQLRNNLRGFPAAPETILLDGLWRDGESVPDRRLPAGASARAGRLA